MTKSLPCLLPSLVLQKSSNFNRYLMLLAGLPLCLGPQMLCAQSVSYSGTAVNFGSVNICPAGQTTPAPCSETETLIFNVTASGTLGPIQVLTLGAPDLDFTLSSGSTCSGSVTQGNTCTAKVQFAPRFAGLRRGGVEVVNSTGDVLADVPVYGIGSGPQITFQPGTESGLLSSILPGGTFDNYGLAIDAKGNVFIAEPDVPAVQEILAEDGSVKTLAYAGPDFEATIGVALDGIGNVFVADWALGRVDEFFAAGGYVTVKSLGDYLLASSVAVDGSGNVFITQGNGKVKEILAAGGYTKFRVLATGFTDPEGVAVDGSGNVFVVDFTSHAVYEILAAGGYTTIKTLSSAFIHPSGVALDAAENVYVTDYGNGTVQEIPAAGGYSTVKTLASGFADYRLWGVAVDESGNVLVGTFSGITKLDFVDPPNVIFPTPTLVGSTDTADGPMTVSVWNNGNQPLLFTGTGSNPEYPGDFPTNSADASLCAAGVPVDPGMSCDVSMNFVPSIDGVDMASVLLTSNALNDSAATRSISLSGQGGGLTPISSLDLNFGTIPLGTSSVLSVTLKNEGASGTPALVTTNEGPSKTSYKVPTAGNTCVLPLATGQSCTLPIEFIPEVSGTHSTHIVVSNAGQPFTINATGSTSGGLVIPTTPLDLDFGFVDTGASSVLTVTIQNGSAGTVTLTAVNEGPSTTSFTIPAAGNTCAAGLAAGQSCTLPVEFTPVPGWYHRAHIRVTPSLGPSFTINAIGTTSE